MPPSTPLMTGNPGLGRYLIRTLGACGLMAIVFFFMAVHLYYTSAALPDLVVLFSLPCSLACFGLSITSLVMSALVGPGKLPSRFSATRMETVLREELQRIVAKAHVSSGSRLAPKTLGSVREGDDGDHNGTSDIAKSARPTEPHRSSPDVDEAESQQLANVASTAAILERGTRAAEEKALERVALDARLRVYNEYSDAASYQFDNDVMEDSHEMRKGGDDSESDASEDTSELPAYLTEAMLMRRQRKVRRGLEIVLVSEAARKVLQAIDDTDVERKQEEMSLLIPGANWCRFCDFYQMNDTRHCVICNQCVYRSKLHSVCTGGCIGYANSKYYVLFVFYLFLYLLMADALDIYCVSKGYTYFFKPSGKSHPIFYLVFVYSGSLALVLVGMLLHYLYAAGRGVGLLTDLLQQRRKELEAARASNNGVEYQPVLSERTAHRAEEGLASPMQKPGPFSWRKAMETVGEGLPPLMWFWPTPTLPAVRETDDPPDFWNVFRRAIRLRLRSVADEDDVFSDEDEVNDDGTADAPASAFSGSASPQPSPATRVPYQAKSTDVRVEAPVVVEVLSSATPVGSTAAALQYANASVPPTAKVAPVSMEKKH
ncbi:hypothetical protein JKF63_06256 [Porcisia hertigi]|uniref:Palmitoyltransferase n=1 Tax=Porcisia hertigi TaxID=2761500 RepID=A0A836IDX4_9TRYP|nr:hypothetical protein JKF63_06256 [Porcisia hertigi]